MIECQAVDYQNQNSDDPENHGDCDILDGQKLGLESELLYKTRIADHGITRGSQKRAEREPGHQTRQHVRRIVARQVVRSANSLSKDNSENEDKQQKLKEGMTDDPEATGKLPRIPALQFPSSHGNDKIAVCENESKSFSNIAREARRTKQLPAGLTGFEVVVNAHS
jgi:hypothetical protein